MSWVEGSDINVREPIYTAILMVFLTTNIQTSDCLIWITVDSQGLFFFMLRLFSFFYFNPVTGAPCWFLLALSGDEGAVPCD